VSEVLQRANAATKTSTSVTKRGARTPIPWLLCLLIGCLSRPCSRCQKDGIGEADCRPHVAKIRARNILRAPSQRAAPAVQAPTRLQAASSPSSSGNSPSHETLRQMTKPALSTAASAHKPSMSSAARTTPSSQLNGPSAMSPNPPALSRRVHAIIKSNGNPGSPVPLSSSSSSSSSASSRSPLISPQQQPRRLSPLHHPVSAPAKSRKAPSSCQRCHNLKYKCDGLM